MSDSPYVVALVGISQPGYRCLANAYLRESLKADVRLPSLAVGVLDFDTTVSAWWIVYRILSLDYQPDVLGFSVYCWNAQVVYEVLRLLEGVWHDDSARPHIILGGPEVGPVADEVCGRFALVDYVASGEGERVICDVVLELSRGRSLKYLPIRDAITDMDALPRPYNDAHPPAVDGSAYLETYRGCPNQCAYCYEGKGSTKIRSFSWDRVARDVEFLAGTPGMQSFSFVDSAFNLTGERLKRLSDILAPFVAKGLRLHTIEVDVEKIDDDAAALLKRAGVVSVETGPQSIGEAALANCKRSFSRERFLRGVAACRREGIRVEADLIVGLPGDGVGDVLASMRFVIEADPGALQVSTLHVLPGTQLWDSAQDLGLVYDKEPPHEVIETREVSYTDLRNLEVFGHALGMLYRSRL